jgi:hypothetical protein
MPRVENALFVRDGERFFPTGHARGPWDLRSLHGGPPAALLGHALEALPPDIPMSVVRVTVEILRPVPVQPMTVTAQVERPGKRVQLLSAVLRAGDDEVCRATAWRIRTTELDIDAAPAEVPFEGPDQGVPPPRDSDNPAFHRTGTEMRFVRGTFQEIGPATVWIRLRMPVIEGEEPTPLMRLLAAADFGNGVSSAVEWGRFLFINTDLTAYVHRMPEGEWICLEARTSVQRSGVGLAESALYDTRGPLGRSLQALLIDRLPG